MTSSSAPVDLCIIIPWWPQSVYAGSGTLEPEHQALAQGVGSAFQLLESGIGVGLFQTLNGGPRRAEGPRQIRQALALFLPGHAHQNCRLHRRAGACSMLPGVLARQRNLSSIGQALL